MPRATQVRPDGPGTTLSYPGPDEFNEPPDLFDDYILTIFGPKGRGKSTAGAAFPDNLTLMFEPMRRGLRIRQLNLVIKTAKEILAGADDVWLQMVNTTPEWIDDPSISRLTFDSIDLTYEACYQSVCARNGVTRPADDTKRSVDIWNELRDEFAGYFNTLRQSGMRITMLSHVKEREEGTLEGSKMGMASPSCSPACLKYIKQASDIVLYYGYYAGKRAMMVRDECNAAFVAPGVEGKFLQPNGKPLYIFEIPDIGLLNLPITAIYDTIKAAFDNKLWDIDIPTSERVASPPPKPKGPPTAPKKNTTSTTSGPKVLNAGPPKKGPPRRK